MTRNGGTTRGWLRWAIVGGAATLLAVSATAAGKKRPSPKPPAPVAASAAPTFWFIGGSDSELPSCTNCEVSFAPSGSTSLGSMNNGSNGQLSPGIAVVASQLNVRIEVAPGAATRSFFLLVRGDVARSLRCDITGAATSCTSGAQTLAIPAASVVLIDAANSGSAPATRVRFSWGAVPG